MNPVARREVLIVSSEPLTREVCHDLLRAEGYECLLAADGREGIEMFQGWRPTLVLTDADLPHMDGLELLQAVHREDPEAAVVVMLGPVRDQHGDAAYVKTVRTVCLKLGAYTVLEKPVNTDDLLLATEGALYLRHMARSQRGLLEQGWAAVRPMTHAAELLAMLGTVFSDKLPRSPRQQSWNDTRPVRAEETKASPMLPEATTSTGTKCGAEVLSRPRASVGAYGKSAVHCRWCGMSNRQTATLCWSCGLPPDAKLSARKRDDALSDLGCRILAYQC